MKSKILLIALSAVCITGCGARVHSDGIVSTTNNDNSSNNVLDVGNNRVVNVSREEPLAGIYTYGHELVEIPMGVMHNNERIDLIDIKVPNNYYATALYRLPDSEEYYDAKEYLGETVSEYIENGVEDFDNVITSLNISAYGNKGCEDIYIHIYDSIIEPDSTYSACKDGVYYKIPEYLKITESLFIININDLYSMHVSYIGSVVGEKEPQEIADMILDVIDIKETDEVVQEDGAVEEEQAVEE